MFFVRDSGEGFFLRFRFVKVNCFKGVIVRFVGFFFDSLFVLVDKD